MRIRFTLLAALTATMLAAPQAQAAQGRNGALAAGLAAGVVGGALLMGATRSHAMPVAEDVEVEVERPRPRYVPTCRMERRRVWIDEESYTYKRIEVCE